MRVALANGCFDILHPGHIAHLEEAATHGQELWVALTEDAHVNKGAGRPIMSWEERAAVLRALRVVHRVVPSISGPQAVLEYRPAVFIKGVDYNNSPYLHDLQAACEQVGARLVLTSTPKSSSGDIVRRAKLCAF